MGRQHGVNGWRVNGWISSFSRKKYHPVSCQCRACVGLRLYPLCVDIFSSRLPKTALRKSSTLLQWENIRRFQRLKVKTDKQTVFRYTKSCSKEAGNELYPMSLGVWWDGMDFNYSQGDFGWPSGKTLWWEGQGTTGMDCLRRAEAQSLEAFKQGVDKHLSGRL